ncbi:type II secretion system protein [Candidatus Microgenomates bacterium]|nr:type II secretion system protein [Candidatus Microgenomates bacterium]
MRNKINGNSVTVTKLVSFSGYVRRVLTLDARRLTKRASLPNNVQRGFTLIELLVVMSVITILATIGLNVYPQAQKQARDQQRKSDLSQYRSGIESYANQNNSLFPGGAAGSGGINAVNLCNISGWSIFMSSCPEDPKNSSDLTFQYKYSGDGDATLSTIYVLWAKLEGFSSTTYWVVCSNGKAGKATSGIPVTGGGCPI